MAFLEDGKWLIVYFMISFVCSQRENNLAKGFQAASERFAVKYKLGSLHTISKKLAPCKQQNEEEKKCKQNADES